MASFRDSFQRLLVYFGLADPAEHAALPGAPSRSRYGAATNPRLDQDLDALTARIEALERRVP